MPLDFVSGLGLEMFGDLTACDGLWHRNTDVEKHKLVLDRMVKKYNCDVLLVTQIVDTIVDGNTVKDVAIQTKTGRKLIAVKRVIDCSGDSDAAYYAGAEMLCGRPGDGMSQACSLEFTLGGVNWDEYVSSDLKKNDPRWVAKVEADLASGALTSEPDNHLNWITHIPGRPEHCGMDEVSICFAHSRNCFPCDNRDLTRMYIEGREQAHMLADYIKATVRFKNSFLTATGSLLGVRESRRVLGEYVLTAYDLASLRKLDDVVAISNHGYDIHNFEAPGNIKWAPMELMKLVMSGDDSIDMFSTIVPKLGTEYLADLTEIKYISLDKPWWDQNYNATFSINGKQCTAVGGLMITHMGATLAMFYNKRIANEYALPDLYQLVKDADRTSAIIEALSYEGYIYLRPKYYETMLQNKFLRDQESIEMPDEYVFTNIGYSLDKNFSSVSTVRKTIISGNGEIASTIAANKSAIDDEISRYIELFK